ncbi:Retrovirus-related Pol polyprotein from transposon TNT 1-94 [Cardamine amara subsp. amara]|uniref:Retrovirus-related Pol polyprotein from transposon TNT 1-94 n=1 Tax=Cardamine amara subsp. amara TaxID=228776 RepID=A0ABD1C577_CARAN
MGHLANIDNLYVLYYVASYPENLNINIRGTKQKLINKTSAALWHKRLGHFSEKRIKHLISDQVLDTLDFSDIGQCVNCIKGKQTNQRGRDIYLSSEVLELIHTYVCGSFPTASWNGHRYFVSFIDDFSRYGHLYLLHEKLEVLDVFKVFKTEVELQLGKHIKAVRSDRGGEYYGRYDGSGEQHP